MLRPGQKTNDVDIICLYDDFTKWCKINKPRIVRPIDDGKKYMAVLHDTVYEFELAWDNSTARSLLDLIAKHTPQSSHIVRNGMLVANPDICYTLKVSHKYLRNSPFFLKTMLDIHWLEEHRCSVPNYLIDWLIERKEATYDYSHPSLKQTKSNFFDGDGVMYIYDHDSIHQAVKHGEQPAYTYFKPDDEDVFCSKDMFDTLDYATRLNSVMEESYVLAIERCLLHYDVTPENAFKMALMKVCSSITSGWWRDFAYDNHDAAITNYNHNFFEQFNNELKAGNVAPHKE